MPKTIAAQGFFEIMGRIKSVSKVVQKTGFFLGQNMDKKRTKNTTFFRQQPCQNRVENRHYGASKRLSERKQFGRIIYGYKL